MPQWTALLPAAAVILVVVGDVACHCGRISIPHLRYLRSGCAATWMAYYTLIAMIYAVHGSVLTSTMGAVIAAAATWIFTRARRAHVPAER